MGASCWCCAVTTHQSCVWRSALTAGLSLLPAGIGRCVFGMFRIYRTHRKPLQAVVLQVWTRRGGRCNNLLSRSLPASGLPAPEAVLRFGATGDGRPTEPQAI